MISLLEFLHHYPGIVCMLDHVWSFRPSSPLRLPHLKCLLLLLHYDLELGPELQLQMLQSDLDGVLTFDGAIW